MSKQKSVRDHLSESLIAIGAPNYGDMTIRVEMRGGSARKVEVLNNTTVLDPTELDQPKQSFGDNIETK